MIKKRKGWLWFMLVLWVVVILVSSQEPALVERYYTNGIYIYIAKLQRIVLGALPISFGDILYSFVIIFFIYKFVYFIKRWKKGELQGKNFVNTLSHLLFTGFWVFVMFYSLWGLNYSRQGIAQQLALQQYDYNVKDLDTLVSLLHRKLNIYAPYISLATRKKYNNNSYLFQQAALGYALIEKKYNFLQYNHPSIKPSMFSYVGNYLGFQGYYNPFTGEAQVNTTIPQSVEAFVAAHEIAHQVGYAKESEANFVGYLACKEHASVNFRYSVYFDMYHYAVRELYNADSLKAVQYDRLLHARVKEDKVIYREFYKKYRNPIEPVISQLYGYFLKANNQPKGKESYSEVVGWLIAYYKKYGKKDV